MTEDEEIKRKVNSTSTKTNALRPDPSISIEAVQNKLIVDSLRDESKNPFWNPVIKAVEGWGIEAGSRVGWDWNACV